MKTSKFKIWLYTGYENLNYFKLTKKKSFTVQLEYAYKLLEKWEVRRCIYNCEQLGALSHHMDRFISIQTKQWAWAVIARNTNDWEHSHWRIAKAYRNWTTATDDHKKLENCLFGKRSRVYKVWKSD